jgi:hypothetical protein
LPGLVGIDPVRPVQAADSVALDQQPAGLDDVALVGTDDDAVPGDERAAHTEHALHPVRAVAVHQLERSFDPLDPVVALSRLANRGAVATETVHRASRMRIP